jgi:hypothetical protein
MSDTIKVLGQLAAAATTEEDLYTVPDLSMTTTSTLMVCNRTAAPLTFRVSVSVNSVATTTKDYLFYDVSLAGNTSMSAVIGMTLYQNDAVRVYASATGLSFNLFGVETSV